MMYIHIFKKNYILNEVFNENTKFENMPFHNKLSDVLRKKDFQ